MKPIDPSEQIRHRAELRRARRPPLNGFVMTGIFFSILLMALLTIGLISGLVVGGVVCAILRARNSRIVRDRVDRVVLMYGMDGVRTAKRPRRR